MRARYDPPAGAVARLRAAADLASSHGSVALVRRCEADLRDAAGRLSPRRRASRSAADATADG